MHCAELPLTIWNSRFNSSLAAARLANLNGIYDIHTNVMQCAANTQPTRARWEIVDDESEFQATDDNARLPHLNPVYGRNFRIHDICLESAPESWFSSAGGEAENTGLTSIPLEALDELPEAALSALVNARDRETSWRNNWHSERVDGLRAHILPSIEWFPK